MPAAYHCGRLFAELEDIQKAAIPGINAGISDKFFGAASSAPASVFGLLLAGARDHLGKLRRTREGAYFGAEKRLEEIMAEIEDFPMTLPLRDQALFSARLLPPPRRQAQRHCRPHRRQAASRRRLARRHRDSTDMKETPNEPEIRSLFRSRPSAMTSCCCSM